jgi:hypothetical protein
VSAYISPTNFWLTSDREIDVEVIHDVHESLDYSAREIGQQSGYHLQQGNIG